jgi:hypothetical protein
MLPRSDFEIDACPRTRDRWKDGRRARVQRDRVVCEPGGVVTGRDRMIDRQLLQLAIVLGDPIVRVVAVIDHRAVRVMRVVVVVVRQVQRRQAFDAEEPRDARDHREQSTT